MSRFVVATDAAAQRVDSVRVREDPSFRSSFILRTAYYLSLPALPDLPFVEVYDRPGADPRRPESANDERSRLYAALNAAVEAEDYEEARRLKEQIDTAMMPEMKDTL